MAEQLVAVVGFAVAAGAALWPYLPKRLPSVLPSPAQPETGLAPTSRAKWVNDLFVLAGQADKANEVAIASAARALIAALVAEREPPKQRGR